MPGKSFTDVGSERKFKEKFNVWLNEKLTPAMGKVGNQRHLASIRDAFAMITPFIIASALGLVLRTSIFGAVGSEQSSLLGLFSNWSGSSFQGTGWGEASAVMENVLASIGSFGLDFISVYFAFAFGYFLSRARGNNAPEIAGLVAVGIFFLVTLGGKSNVTFLTAEGNTSGAATLPLVGTYMNSAGLFTAIIATIISIEIYCSLCNVKAFEIKMPAGVPPAISRAFAKLLPIVLTSLSMAGILAIVVIPTSLTKADVLTSQSVKIGNGPLSTVIGISQTVEGSFYNLGDLFYMGIQAPFVYIATIQGANLAIGVIFTFFVSFFWFFGLHGSNIVGSIFNPVFLVLLDNNQHLLATGGLELLRSDGNIFVYQTVEAFIQFGGVGATLSLILATVWFGKRPSDVAVAKFSIPSGVFNINEPVAFGYPLVTNLRWAIPYIFTMPILTVTTFLLYKAFGTVPIYAVAPWTSPIGIAALIATGFDYTSFFIVLINFALAFLCWGPFIWLSNRLYKNEQRSESRGNSGSSGSGSGEAVAAASQSGGE